jgi:hypothetical protein
MIDEDRIKKNLEIFSFPRLSGTENERRAFNIAKAKIMELKLNPLIQNFSFSTFYSRIYPKIALVLSFWILWVLTINNDFSVIILYLIIISSIYLILFLYTRKPERITIGKKRESQNLIVKLPANVNNSNDIHRSNHRNVKDNDKNVYFLSHLDSKGQRFSINMRIKSYKIWLYSSLIIVIIYFLKFIITSHFFTWFYFLGVFFLCVNFICTIIIVINSTNNKSLGAIDNASGVVCVMELLNHYLEENSILQNFNLNFVFTGCEETGTIGIRHFHNSLKFINRKKAIVFNFDGISRNTEAFGKRKNSSIYKKFYEIFKKEAYKQRIELKVNRFYIGVHSDGIYMLRKKRFLGIGFGDSDSYKFVHSVRDTIDKVDSLVLKQLCQLIVNFIEKLDIHQE